MAHPLVGPGVPPGNVTSTAVLKMPITSAFVALWGRFVTDNHLANLSAKEKKSKTHFYFISYFIGMSLVPSAETTDSNHNTTSILSTRQHFIHSEVLLICQIYLLSARE